MLFKDYLATKKNSKETAKERLQLVLIHDRASLSKGIVDDLKKDLIAVISKYMEFDEKNLEVQVEDKEDMAILEVNIPISQLKRSY